MRYWLFKSNPWAYALLALSFGVLGYGSYAWYRVHGNWLWLVLLFVPFMWLVQNGFRQLTKFGLPPWVERCGAMLLVGAALCYDATSPSIDAQGNALVVGLLVLCAVFVLAVVGGTAAVIVALVRRKV